MPSSDHFILFKKKSPFELQKSIYYLTQLALGYLAHISGAKVKTEQ